MGRSESKQVFNQGTQQSTQNQQQANQSFQATQNGLNDFQNRLNQYYLNDPYKAGGEFAQAQKTIATSRANANSNALGNELRLSGLRSGENTAGYANTLAAAQRQGTRDTADALAKAETERIGDE